MLVIKNIDKLEHQTIGAWKVMGVEIDFSKTSNFPDSNYTIRLSRNGDVSAAIVIERKAGQYGYNVSICYEEYDNVISITPWPKDRLESKDNFMASMRGVIDAEYNKKN